MTADEARLRVTAGSPIAELFLVDHEFVLVARGVGELDLPVAAGTYEIKAKLGDAADERLVLVRGGEEVDVAFDLSVGSAVPIEGTANARSSQIRAAEDESRSVAARAGRGAGLFVLARGWSAPGEQERAPRASLHRLDGERIAEATAVAEAGDGPIRSTTVEVDPGPYLLRRTDDVGDVAEQCVHAVEGWQTQVFLVEEAAPGVEVGRTRVSVLMSRHGFDPHDDELRLVEDARTALAGERLVASEELGERFEHTGNPMLGMFGAHLMLVARRAERERADQRARGGEVEPRRASAPARFDGARFGRIVDGLREALGDRHPDVVALRTQQVGDALHELEPIAAPPMLWRSWVLLVHASNAAPWLVPAELWRRTVHVLPLRPFFLWSPATDGGELADGYARNVVLTLGSPSAPPGAPPRRAPAAMLPGAGPAAAEPDARTRLSRQLLVPRAVIDALADGRGP